MTLHRIFQKKISFSSNIESLELTPSITYILNYLYFFPSSLETWATWAPVQDVDSWCHYSVSSLDPWSICPVLFLLTFKILHKYSTFLPKSDLPLLSASCLSFLSQSTITQKGIKYSCFIFYFTSFLAHLFFILLKSNHCPQNDPESNFTLVPWTF